jgi:hypothetical protein
MGHSRRRLAGPVRPQQADDLAALDEEIHAVHGPLAGIVLDEAIAFEKSHGIGPP